MSSHTVTTTKSWFERLGNSFGGIIFGIILFIAGTVLLWWNEGNFVKTQTALNEAQAVTKELGSIDAVDSASNGQLVHATGLAITQDVLEDPIFGISTNAIRLERAVEYYQWMEDSKSETRQKLGGGEETVTTYSYHKDWVKSPVDSSRFNSSAAREEHKNTVIINIDNFSVQATNVAFGAYRLPKFLVDSISGSESYSVALSDDVIAKLNQQIMPSVLPSPQPPTPEPPVKLPSDTPSDVPAQGMLPFEEDEPVIAPPVVPSTTQFVHASGSTVYFGQTPEQPSIGDVRVGFKRLMPCNISIIAKQNGDTFEPFITKNGRTVSMLNMGTVSAEYMFKSAHASNSIITWVLRIVGVFLVCISLTVIFAQLQVLASVVPFLGKLVGVGTGLFSVLLGLAWSLLVIAVAWLFYRPLIGILILAVAVGLIVLLYTRRSGDQSTG